MPIVPIERGQIWRQIKTARDIDYLRVSRKTKRNVQFYFVKQDRRTLCRWPIFMFRERFVYYANDNRA
jgi:hypothetical protein